ncbi:putative accessory gene regulator protein [uncultured Clostridium sp.]|uniref:accessory gene regulator ArgB-like protein n=1 Tax=uncultured Clostridium sp. TaxID=59620 RepID=UPI000822588E|nr:accessory gene regulator B family protein [uncultured Clostridium sp.]SCJ98909.1 putative accessory gene regulator protein [uncultured Clostridium sp.]
MFSVEKISKKISSSISKELEFDNEKEEVINYGIFAFIQMFISIILVGIVGIILGVFTEALLISFVTAILRKSSGGVHAGTPGSCNVIGTIASIVMGFVAKFAEVNIYGVALLGGIIFCIAYITIYRLAPVDSMTKPINSIAKRKRLKRSSLIIISIYLAIVVVNVGCFLVFDKKVFITYTICIYLGVLWQVFSLTKFGHLVLKKLDGLIT